MIEDPAGVRVQADPSDRESCEGDSSGSRSAPGLQDKPMKNEVVMLKQAPCLKRQKCCNRSAPERQQERDEPVNAANRKKARHKEERSPNFLGPCKRVAAFECVDFGRKDGRHSESEIQCVVRAN